VIKLGKRELDEGNSCASRAGKSLVAQARGFRARGTRKYAHIASHAIMGTQPKDLCKPTLVSSPHGEFSVPGPSRKKGVIVPGSGASLTGLPLPP
jgi:hypothetical protein